MVETILQALNIDYHVEDTMKWVEWVYEHEVDFKPLAEKYNVIECDLE